MFVWSVELDQAAVCPINSDHFTASIIGLDMLMGDFFKHACVPSCLR
jgi:hypothetical protein